MGRGRGGRGGRGGGGRGGFKRNNSSHRWAGSGGAVKRRKRNLEEMEEKHVLDTYDEGNFDYKPKVVQDFHEDPAVKEAESEDSSDESEVEDAYEDLLNEFGKTKSNGNYADSDEEDSEEEEEEDEDLDEEAEEGEEESEDGGEEDGDESDASVGKQENGKAKKQTSKGKSDTNEKGDREASTDEEDGASSDEEEYSNPNYNSHLEWEPDDKAFPPDPYVLSNVTQMDWPYIGNVKIQALPKPVKGAKEIKMKPGTKVVLRKTLMENMEDTLKQQKEFTKSPIDKTKLSLFEENILNILNSYRDLYYPEQDFDKAESLRLAYTLHIMNHVLKSRALSVRHSTRIRRSGGSVEYQDQGLTRLKAVIVCPFKNSAYRTIKLILKMVNEIKLKIMNEDRFEEEFFEADDDRKRNKPEDYYKFFQGNVDDHFRIGLRFTRKKVQLYSNFYSSDVLVCSPLGLRTIIGAEGDEKRDFDFLSSIEILVLDQADVYFMQNWEHVLDIFKLMNIKPKESHGVDFSRVRTWCVSEWAKYFRQNIIISQVQNPAINALIKRYNFNYRGMVTVNNPVTSAAITQVIAQVPQVFKSFDAETAAGVSDARFKFFTTEILPQLMKDQLLSHCMIYVRSYFDFVRLRNHMRELAEREAGFKFTQICEYTEDGKAAKSRYLFFHGKRKFLLFTERFHFFHRYTIKGIRNLIFYELPTYPHLYSELINMMVPSNQYKLSAGMESTFRATTLYCKYDLLSILPALGEDRTSLIIHQRQKKLHIFSRE